MLYGTRGGAVEIAMQHEAKPIAVWPSETTPRVPLLLVQYCALANLVYVACSYPFWLFQLNFPAILCGHHMPPIQHGAIGKLYCITNTTPM